MATPATISEKGFNDYFTSGQKNIVILRPIYVKLKILL